MTREEYLLKPFKDNADLIADRTRTGIETGRKGYAEIAVKTADGQPVREATVRLIQKTHDFKYGANLFMIDEFECEEKNAAYREVFKNHFNLATLPFYWDTLEPEEGKPRFAKDSPRVYRRPAPDLCLEYCEENGIAPKAHCLHYDHFEPEWLKKYDEATQWKKLEKRMRECAERYAHRIHGWEVTNESYWSTSTTPMYHNPLFMEKSFQLAEHYFPTNELISNEGLDYFPGGARNLYPYYNPYFMQVERAILKGARIDTIGFQYHIWCTPENEADVVAHQCDAVSMYRSFDAFASLNRPLQITEITLPCHDPFSHEAEQLQAEMLKQLYTIWFGIPQMEAVIYWNLVDGYAFNAEPGDFTAGENKLAGGLMHFDLTPKPALTMLRHLFEKEWHTDETLTIGESGCARFKGFYGEYDVEVTVDGRTIRSSLHLSRNGDFMPTFTVMV